jgi:acetyltransferase-like isoleucine patch superfamily enzyme
MQVKRLVKNLYLILKNKGNIKIAYNANIGIKSVFEGMNKIEHDVSFSGYMGYGSYISGHSEINGKIGRFCAIGPYVMSNTGRHPIYAPFASVSPAFYSLQKQNGWTFTNEQRYGEYAYADEKNKYGIIIGNDCWIGQGAFLKGGVKIADGAVIGAHAVVVHDIPPYAVAVGSPAKVKKYRYDEATINYLLKVQWWNQSIEWLRKNADALCDLQLLKQRLHD